MTQMPRSLDTMQRDFETVAGYYRIQDPEQLAVLRNLIERSDKDALIAPIRAHVVRDGRFQKIGIPTQIERVAPLLQQRRVPIDRIIHLYCGFPTEAHYYLQRDQVKKAAGVELKW